MHRAKGGPGPPPFQDIYEFSMDSDETGTQIFLRGPRVAMEGPGVRLSPHSEYIQTEHQQGGLFSLGPPAHGVPHAAPQGKKRRRCGVCAPCMQKENCGTCSNCMNRKIGKQICKLRKCDQLKKKGQKDWETASDTGSVDGPRRGDQMETGSHDRREEGGSLSLEPTNGVSRQPSDTHEEGGAGLEPQREPHRSGSVPPRQGWVPGQGKAPHPQKQLPCSGWSSSGRTPGKHVHEADMEDAHNLVAFSASVSVGSLAPNPEPQSYTAQLYEKFNQEMGTAEGAAAQARLQAPEGGNQASPPEDLNTLQTALQTALSQARHGHKPPNCDCDGPDCPDYLEWLEKRIKQAGAGEEQDNNTPCSKMTADTVPHQQPPHSQQLPHPHPHPHPHVNGGNPPSCPPLHPQQQGQHPGFVPCSPQVLSIAKEKNVSLQTAIAIEALTQLSATAPQTMVPPAQASSTSHHPQQPPLHLQHGNRLLPSSPGPLSSSSSSRSQSVPPGLYPQQSPVSWEQQHRPQSQGHPAHASPLPSSTSPFPGQTQAGSPHPHPQQWQKQQAPGGTQEQRNQWMMMNSDSQQSHFAPPSGGHSVGDPMSELKQLLGDSSGKYINSPFKLPILHHHIKQEPGMPQVKQEVDSGEYQSSACAYMGGRYGLMNGQQQPGYPGPPLSAGSTAIHYSTQTALQQHLHHKRNLFSNPPGPPGLCPPWPTQACQNLRKWWPQQMGPEGHLIPVAIKQEPKEPKRRKSMAGTSPLLKQQPGMLLQPGPKPKTIVIKKTKQKASLPTFLPHSQISIQKPSPLTMIGALPLASTHPGSLPFSTFPVLSNPTQAAAGLPAPAQTQVSILNSSIVPSVTAPAFSVNTPAVSTPQPLPAAPDAPASSGEVRATQTSTTSQSIPGLSSLDPKFEELILQFEAEFGDSSSSAPEPCPPQIQPQDQAPSASASASAQPVVIESHPNINSGQARPASPSPSSTTTTQPCSPTPLASTTAPPADQVMEVDKEKVSGGVSEASSTSTTQPSTESPMEEQREGAQLPLSLRQEVHLEQQQHSVLEDPFTMPLSPSASPLPKRMKIETNGKVAVLSTTGLFSEGGEDDTPTKDGFPLNPSLKGFLESPLRYLDTPTKSLLDTPAKDLQAEFPTCDCVEQILEKDEGPYYNHLGSGPTVASIRELMETRYGEKGDAIRIEKVIYTGREGKSSQGCPIAKWVIRRGSEIEKLLCLVRPRPGHHCPNAIIIILIMAWEGVPRALGDKLYKELAATLTKFGNPTSRRCGLNDDRTCACQGKDPDSCGASFSFGCSWSMYFNGCKYARSKIPRKFRLAGDHPQEEDQLRDNFQDLATEVAPLYKQLAPQAYSNQCQNETKAPDCRLGLKEGRPFSGVTACMDFCAHAHKDQHNLYNGCTVVCTLTKEDNRTVGEIPEDEQLHVLPLYKAALTDEFGSEEGQRQKMRTGAIQVLNNFRREVRKLPERAKSCRQRRLDAKNRASEKKKGKQQPPTSTETLEKSVIKMEVRHAGSPVRQHGNKAIPKQEVKPTIKKEPVDQRFQPFNGQLEGYPAQSADPYHVYPSHTGYYARGGLPSNGQPPALPPPPGPVNGYRPNLPSALPYGYYNYPPNPSTLFPHELTYEGRKGSWHHTGPKFSPSPLDKKPDVQSLQARLAHTYSGPGHLELQQQHGDPANQHQRCAYPHPHQPDYNQSRPSSVSSEPSHRGTPVIKQEPMDMPVYEGGNAQSCPGTTPQPGAAGGPWPGHKPNGSMVPSSWEGNLQSPGPPEAPFTSDKQQFHQQGPHQTFQSPYLQEQYQHPPQQPSPYSQQWNSYPGPNTPMASPAPSPSPSIKVPPSPSPSPHPGTPRHWDSPVPSPQPWPIGMVPAGYSPSPTGGFPDKMWSKAGESWGSTPLGLQEKAWKSSGGSMASTPSPAPEGRLFPDALQQSAGQSQAETPRNLEEEERWSDSEHNFLDPSIGGVAVAPAHGSILIECARRELHATTPLKRPDRSHPTRISLVFYQHKNMNQPCHGQLLWEAKMKMLAERARERQQEAALLGLPYDDIKPGKKRKLGATAAGASPGPGQTTDKREGPVTRLAPTQHTTSTVTVSPYAFTTLTGPYSHFV
ncbi:methylcytosine dioxygenase tet3-like isoform X2 [Coregonus clupeaformis]|uniref:methylcytosine dioxygenase tet3-like isoform X2 n=1 Tax=Coregonus clupeaformis TaxID=59861 RepID=UPI001E1C803D|nr:methylcytosine dioxygenase tet3-like isoform X2 [Coregonus clupeaformis]